MERWTAVAAAATIGVVQRVAPAPATWASTVALPSRTPTPVPTGYLCVASQNNSSYFVYLTI